MVDHLGVLKLFAVVGGSMGGMQALQWVVEYPNFSEKAIIIAATTLGIRFKQLPLMKLAGAQLWVILGGKKESMSAKKDPAMVLLLPRMMAHITYLSDHGMEEKFGGEKRLDSGENLNLAFKRYLVYPG